MLLNRSKKYYINNRELIRGLARNKCKSLTEDEKQKMKDQQKEYQKIYREAKKDYQKEYQKKYREAKKYYQKEYQKKWARTLSMMGSKLERSA